MFAETQRKTSEIDYSLFQRHRFFKTKDQYKMRQKVTDKGNHR